MSADPATPDQTLSIGITSDVGDVALALAAALKAFDDLFSVFNSPQMLAARKNVDIQALLLKMDNDLKQAQKTGDFSQVDKESS